MEQDDNDADLRQLVIALRQEVRALTAEGGGNRLPVRIVEEPVAPLRRARTQVGGTALADHLGEIIADRDLRERYFKEKFCEGPAWNIIIDLAQAMALQKSISVTSACVAARGPATTALRYIAELEAEGMVVRKPDVADKRRYWLSLSDKAYFAVCDYVEARNARGRIR